MIDGAEAGAIEHRDDDLARVGQVGRRRGQVVIRLAVREQRADEGHDLSEPQSKAGAPERPRVGSATSSSDSRPPGRSTRAISSKVACEVGEVAQRVAAGDAVEAAPCETGSDDASAWTRSGTSRAGVRAC